MCNPKPGARCATHALERLNSRRADLQAAVDAGDLGAIAEKTKLATEAQWDYDASSGGREALSRDMDKTAPRGTERYLLEQRLQAAYYMGHYRSVAALGMPPERPDDPLYTGYRQVYAKLAEANAYNNVWAETTTDPAEKRRLQEQIAANETQMAELAKVAGFRQPEAITSRDPFEDRVWAAQWRAQKTHKSSTFVSADGQDIKVDRSGLVQRRTDGLLNDGPNGEPAISGGIGQSDKHYRNGIPQDRRPAYQPTTTSYTDRFAAATAQLLPADTFTVVGAGRDRVEVRHNSTGAVFEIDAAADGSKRAAVDPATLRARIEQARHRIYFDSAYVHPHWAEVHLKQAADLDAALGLK